MPQLTPGTPQAGTHTTPGGDHIATLTLDHVTVNAYRSPEDGAPVVEIDTDPELVEVRVYLNDGSLFAGDPDAPATTAEVIRRAALAFLHGQDTADVSLEQLAAALGVPVEDTEALPDTPGPAQL